MINSARSAEALAAGQGEEELQAALREAGHRRRQGYCFN